MTIQRLSNLSFQRWEAIGNAIANIPNVFDPKPILEKEEN